MAKDYNPTDLAGQRADKAEEDARKRALRQQEIGDLKWLMSSPKGRRIVRRLLEKAGPFRATFNTNAMQMAFNEGFRNYGNWLLNEVITLTPEMYPVMLKEQHDDRDGDGDLSN